MTVLDAQALVALLRGEPAGGEVEAVLRDPADRAIVSAVNLAEVVDVLVRHDGYRVDEVVEKLRWLTVGGLEVQQVDEAIGLLAGRVRARQHSRVDRPVSLADCVALATALAEGERLATADGALLSAAVEEGCRVMPLLDSAGRRPSLGGSVERG